MSKQYKMDLESNVELVNYQPKIIQSFAQKLYSKADSIEALYSIAGLLVGLFMFVGASGAGKSEGAVVLVMAISGAILGLYIGKQIGISRAIQYRIEAQKALCFVEIEKNTKATIEAIHQASHDAVTQIKLRSDR